MPAHFDYESLEDLSKGKGLNQVQHIFNILISELGDFLNLEPIYQDITIKVNFKDNFTKGINKSILDFGVIRVLQSNKLIIKLNKVQDNFLPFILLREAYYCFVDKKASDVIKICINQILENDLNRLSASKEWKKLIRDSLVNRDFIHSQFDKLQKFFKIRSRESLDSSIKFFFKEVRENTILNRDDNINSFYDLIFEKYSYKTSRSLFNKDIVETLRVLIKLFYETKLYLNLTDYNTLFRELKQKKDFDTDLSLRKFNENIQWINKCSFIAPSYDPFNSSLDYGVIVVIIRFHPLLEKSKIKMIMEKWPFYQTLQFSENSFAKISLVSFIIPKVYINDLLNYFNRLEEYGYIIIKELYRNLKKTSTINLNYFKDISNIKKIINPKSKRYKKKYEILTIKDYDPVPTPYPLTIFDYVVLERARHYSVTGLTFDKRVETLNAIKEDLENELRKETLINKEFKKALDIVFNSSQLKRQFLRFLDENREYGLLFLYYQLNQILNYLELTEKILRDHPEIINNFQLQALLDTRAVFNSIEQYLLIQDNTIKKIIFQDFLPLYFQAKNSFKEEMEKVYSFYNILKACYNLKILNLNTLKRILEDPKLADEIYQTREKRYQEIFKPVSSYKITNEKIESIIKTFVNHVPPLINPSLINTILTSTFAKYYPELILKDTPETREELEKIRFLFPRTYIFETIELSTQKKSIHVFIYLVNIKEKSLFLSLLCSLFKDSLITMRRYFWRGVTRYSTIQPKDFYDFEKKKFTYTKELFDQLFIYSQKILGKKLDWIKYASNNNIKDFLWLKKQKVDDLVNAVKSRISYQNIDFNLRELTSFSGFKKNLKSNLLDPLIFNNFKAKNFFKRYINSIKLYPAFQKFGLSQYYLYFRPFYYEDIDFKLLFANSFQDIKYPACFEPNQAIFNEFIFPYRNPNKSYLNWLVKSKKNVSEYCLFYKKKFYEIIHFNRNLVKEGWNYSSIRFKSYMQDILFNPNYDPKISSIREFDINTVDENNFYGSQSQEFESLIQIYNIHSIDLKSYLGTRNYSIINSITNLLEKNLIFPYLSLKNLDFEEKVSIVLPDIKPDFNEIIIKIFEFFNVCHIYEIEGEYFIYGFEDIRTFENGFLIEIWFPRCELDEFFEIFDLLFQYLKIKKYLILTDLVKGTNLLKSVYGTLNFLDSYTPIKNLIWNKFDKKWMNHKLFNEKFEPLYPDLHYGNDK